MSELRDDTAIILYMFEKKFTGIFWCYDEPFGAFGWGTWYLWVRTYPLDVSYGKLLEDIERICSKSRKTKASMADWYVIDKKFGFCPEYMPSYTVTNRKL